MLCRRCPCQLGKAFSSRQAPMTRTFLSQGSQPNPCPRCLPRCFLVPRSWQPPGLMARSLCPPPSPSLLSHPPLTLPLYCSPFCFSLPAIMGLNTPGTVGAWSATRGRGAQGACAGAATGWHSPHLPALGGSGYSLGRLQGGLVMYGEGCRSCLAGELCSFTVLLMGYNTRWLTRKQTWGSMSNPRPEPLGDPLTGSCPSLSMGLPWLRRKSLLWLTTHGSSVCPFASGTLGTTCELATLLQPCFYSSIL